MLYMAVYVRQMLVEKKEDRLGQIKVELHFTFKMDSNQNQRTKERTDHSSKTTTVIYHPTVARHKFSDAVMDRPMFLFLLRGIVRTKHFKMIYNE